MRNGLLKKIAIQIVFIYYVEIKLILKITKCTSLKPVLFMELEQVP